jgi:hypothetical protein
MGHTVSRRTTLRSLLSLPVFASVFGIGATAHSAAAEDTTRDARLDAKESFDQRYLAVRTLRFVNTAQNLYQRDTGNYAELASLLASSSLQQMLTNPTMERTGQGATFFSQLNFSQREVAPGWELVLQCAKNGKRYIALVSDVNGNLQSFATDQKGRIYEGHVLDSTTMNAHRALHGLSNDIRIKGLGLLQNLATATTLPANGCDGCLFCKCTKTYPCCCDGCGEFCVSRCDQACSGCVNCGCASCVWCCCTANPPAR